MSFTLINPFIYGAPPLTDLYSMSFTASQSTSLFINNRSNDIDTTLRDTTPNFTISGWIKPGPTNSTTRYLFSKYDNAAANDRCFVLYFDASNKIAVYGQYDTTNSSVLMNTTAAYTSTSTWIHVAFVYDSSHTVDTSIAKLYVNGVIVSGAGLASFTINTANKKFYNQTTEGSRAHVAFGSDGATSIGNFNEGTMDECTFWNTSLPPADITTLYNSGTFKDVSAMSNYTADCIAWYRMGDAVGDVFNSPQWTITNYKGTASTDLVSSGMTVLSRVVSVP